MSIRFAVCMVGHVFDWPVNNDCKNSFLQYVGVHNPDVYIDIYDEQTSKPHNPDPLSERNVRKYTDEELSNMFNEIPNVQYFNREVVNPTWIADKLEKANVYLRGNDVANNYRTYCLVRKIHQCYHVLKNSGKEYDVIMITSPGVIYTGPIDLNIQPDWFYNADVNYPIPQDIVVMGSPDIIDIFAKRFDVLDIMYRVHTCMGACVMDRNLLFRYVACLHNLDWKWKSTIPARYLGC